MSLEEEARETPVDTYEAPEVEDLDTADGPAVTAAGVDSIVG